MDFIIDWFVLLASLFILNWGRECFIDHTYNGDGLEFSDIILGLALISFGGLMLISLIASWFA